MIRLIEPKWVLLALSLFVVSPIVAWGQTDEAGPVRVFSKDEVDRSIEKAIQYLLSVQKETGSINDKGHDTTMTALSIMAF
ncbi:MAG: hypothetical protein VX739_08160, partial [Planctomycetota bacterium]|nr:hypothetical protein [Planctomycetota bacterium]